MYESPIEIMYGEMKMQVVDNVVKAVQEQQIHVDREELIKALRGERNQYQKGYADAAKEIFAEIDRCFIALIKEHPDLVKTTALNFYDTHWKCIAHNVMCKYDPGFIIKCTKEGVGE